MRRRLRRAARWRLACRRWSRAIGRIDILVNNVAISDNKTILDITEEEWDRVIAVTLKSPFLMAQHVARHMVAQGTGGKIVNIGSTSGYRGRSRAIAYSAAKGGVANLTRALAVQLAPHGIRVNCDLAQQDRLARGQDEFDPTRPITNLVHRPGQPIETARAVLFLVSDDASFILGENIFRRWRRDGDGGAVIPCRRASGPPSGAAPSTRQGLALKTRARPRARSRRSRPEESPGASIENRRASRRRRRSISASWRRTG